MLFAPAVYIIASVGVVVLVRAYYLFPESELTALQIFYNETHGDDWIYDAADNEAYWNFTAISDTYNPCTAKWEGVYCTSDCQDSPCSVQLMLFVSNGMYGQLPDVFDSWPLLTNILFVDTLLSGIAVIV